MVLKTAVIGEGVNDVHHLSAIQKEELSARLKTVCDAQGNQIYLYGPVKMPVRLGDAVYPFNWYTWFSHPELPAGHNDFDQFYEALQQLDTTELQQSSVLTYGDFQSGEQAKVRIHSICHTGDIFGSLRCDCGSQLHRAMQEIAAFGTGAVLYVANHEGRGIGLFNKAMTYTLQEQGVDTLAANVTLGFEPDQRTYEMVAAVLLTLREKQITLLSNNPDKYMALQSYGVKIANIETLIGEVTEYNMSYLNSKMQLFGHHLVAADEENLTRSGDAV